MDSFDSITERVTALVSNAFDATKTETEGRVRYVSTQDDSFIALVSRKAGAEYTKVDIFLHHERFGRLETNSAYAAASHVKAGIRAFA